MFCQLTNTRYLLSSGLLHLQARVKYTPTPTPQLSEPASPLGLISKPHLPNDSALAKLHLVKRLLKQPLSNIKFFFPNLHVSVLGARRCPEWELQAIVSLEPVRAKLPALHTCTHAPSIFKHKVLLHSRGCPDMYHGAAQATLLPPDAGLQSCTTKHGSKLPIYDTNYPSKSFQYLMHFALERTCCHVTSYTFYICGFFSFVPPPF